MKFNLHLCSLLLLLSTFDAMTQGNSKRFEFSPATAHPNAKALMKEDFFWNPIDETGPFGSDAGSDAAYGFQKWRENHLTTSPVVYLKELITEWALPKIAWDELDTIKLKEYFSAPANMDETTIDQLTKVLKQQNDEFSKAGKKKLSDDEIRQIVLSSQKNMGHTYLVSIDEAIIGTAFAQFVLEGKVDPPLKHFAEKAIQREMLPIMTRQYPEDGQKAHKVKCNKMLYILSKTHA